MVINKRNQLYKPERILYYIEASDSDIEAFCNGVVCDKIKKYADSFGAYDYPGVFFIHPLGKKVIGIEFRRGDARIAYPDDLDSLVLESSFFYAVEFEKENEITEQYIQVYIQKTKQTLLFDDDAHRQYSDLAIKTEPNVTAVFEHAKKIRILYECALKKNHAKDVIANNLDELDKGMLYRKAFFDPITNYYNWNHLVPYLEIPESAGIKDYAFAHFDIKMFKVLNEIYGHIVANKVLTNVVNAIKAADFIYAGGRCHEDNFAIILKDMPQEETAEKLEIFLRAFRILKKIRIIRFIIVAVSSRCNSRFIPGTGSRMKPRWLRLWETAPTRRTSFFTRKRCTTTFFGATLSRLMSIPPLKKTNFS